MSKELTNENPKDKFIKLTSTGIVDLELTVVLTEQEAEMFNIIPENLQTITDCLVFLTQIPLENQTNKTDQFKKPNITDYIRINSPNATLNSLLVINRAFKKKAFIEFIALSEIKFKESDLFLKEVIKNITEQNFLFIVENNFLKNLNTKIKFTIKINNKIVKFFDNICLSQEEEDPEKDTQIPNEDNLENLTEKKNLDLLSIKSQNEKISNNLLNSKENFHKNEQIENPEDKKSDIQLPDKLNLKNFDDEILQKESKMHFSENEQDPNKEHIFLTRKDPDVKSNSNDLDLTTNKIINSIPQENENRNNFSNNYKNNEEQDFNLKENNEQILIDENNKENNNISLYERFKYDFSGCNYFFVDMNEIFQLKKYNFSLKEFHELLQTITNKFKEINIIILYPNIFDNITSLDLESINILNEIIGLTDIYIFDKKDALALFNLMGQINSEEDSYEDKKNLGHLFIKEIKKKRKNHPKIGIFLDELSKCTIIEQQSGSNLILFHTDYEFNIIPANVSKVVTEDYKKLFVVHYDYLKSIFIGGLFSRLLHKKSFNSSFTAGNESLKRVVELLRFNLDQPMDSNYYIIRIKKNQKIVNEEEKLKTKKEQHFVLDCSNVVNSKMKEYNPLYDDNLTSFFSSRYVRKHLKNLGFINNRGNILQDPDNKKLGIIESKKLSKIYEQEKVTLQKIKDKKEKLKLQIKNLLHGNNIMKTGHMKEIEKLSKVYNFYPQSDKKLPSINEFKNSITKNIKINNEMYTKEMKKGRNFKPRKDDSQNHHEGNNENNNVKTIENLNEKNLSRENDEYSKAKEVNNTNSNNLYLISKNSKSNQDISQKIKSGKSKKTENNSSRIKSSSVDKNIMNHAGENEEKSLNLNENIIDKKALQEEQGNLLNNSRDNSKNFINSNNENINNQSKLETNNLKGLDEENVNNNSHLNLNQSKIENNKILENSLDNISKVEGIEGNNISKISKKNDISVVNDLNISKKSNRILETNNNPNNESVIKEKENNINNVSKAIIRSVENDEGNNESKEEKLDNDVLQE